MRKIIEMAGTVVAVVIAAAFIWLVLSAPGFIVDEASTVPIAGTLGGKALIDVVPTAPGLPLPGWFRHVDRSGFERAPSLQDPAHRSHRSKRPFPKTEKRSREMRPLALWC